jgi:hypothetical protein
MLYKSSCRKRRYRHPASPVKGVVHVPQLQSLLLVLILLVSLFLFLPALLNVASLNTGLFSCSLKGLHLAGLILLKLGSAVEVKGQDESACMSTNVS